MARPAAMMEMMEARWGEADEMHCQPGTAACENCAPPSLSIFEMAVRKHSGFYLGHVH